MKKISLLLLFGLLFLSVVGQTKKLENYTIWNVLYPNNQNFENDTTLVRKVNRDGADYLLKTGIGKVFYYKSGLIQKATVILFSYDFTNGNVKDCHGCSPEFEIATFTYISDKWIKEKFVQNWSHAVGSWGEPADLTLSNFKNVKCLVLKYSYTARGKTESYIDRYNIETLKEIK